MYTTHPTPLPDDLRAELEARLARRVAGPARSALAGTMLFLAILAVTTPCFALALWVEAPARRGAIALVLGGVLVVGWAIFLLLFIAGRRRDARAVAAEAAAIRADLAAGELLAHELVFDGPQLFAEHEHGVMVLSPAGPGRTLYLDLSSVADDSRWDALGKAAQVPRTWRWLTSRDGQGHYRFAATGEPFTPERLEVRLGGYDPELPGDLFEQLGSPGDGEVIERDFGDVERFVAAAVARAGAKAGPPAA